MKIIDWTIIYELNIPITKNDEKQTFSKMKIVKTPFNYQDKRMIITDIPDNVFYDKEDKEYFTGKDCVEKRGIAVCNAKILRKSQW